MASDDHYGKTAIRELVAAVRVLATSTVTSHGVFGEVMAHLDRAEDQAEKIDRPRGVANDLAIEGE
jgi:hypothetical protein